MADLTDQQAGETVKITGANSSGVETNYVNADSNGNLQVLPTPAGPVTPGTVAANSELIGGQYNTTLPSPTNGQQVAVQLDYKGRIITSPIAYSFFHPIYTTRIQSVTGATSVNNATSLTVNLSKPTTAGSLIVVVAGRNNGTLTCTDSAAQSYSTATNIASTDNSYIFYFANSAAGVTSVTINCPATSGALELIASEYSNITTSSPLDKTSTNQNTATTSWTSNATATTTQANELLIGAAAAILHNNTTFTAGTSWTAVATQAALAGGTNLVSFQEEQYVISTGEYAATGTTSGNDTELASIATFKMSSLPTGFTVPNTATVIKSGTGTLAGITVNTLGTGRASVTFYDNTTNSGTVIATVDLTNRLGQIAYNLKFTNGLTMVVNSISSDFTVTYD